MSGFTEQVRGVALDNGAALVGLYRAATRRQSVQWERPPRVLTCSAAEHESGGQES